MKKIIIITAVMGLLLSIHVSAHAQELNSRKGFTFTLEMPGIGFSNHGVAVWKKICLVSRGPF